MNAYRHDTDLAQHLHLLVVPHKQNPPDERILPRIQLDAAYIREQLAHEPRAVITVLHLALLHPLQEACDERVERHGEDHDGDADKGGPSEYIV